MILDCCAIEKSYEILYDVNWHGWSRVNRSSFYRKIYRSYMHITCVLCICIFMQETVKLSTMAY